MALPPDYVEPRVGWRVWDVAEVGGELRLCSLAYRTVWYPGREVEARCRRSLAALPWERMPLHGPPSRDCVCGIYGVERPALALPYLRCQVRHAGGTIQRVIGLVSLWGRVVECEWGWRAAFGYPALVVVPRSERGRVSRLLRAVPTAAALSEALADYAVPVELVDEPAAGRLATLASVTVAG
jgi:hypothetical protein